MLHRQLISSCLFVVWSARSALAVDIYVAENTAGTGSGTNALGSPAAFYRMKGEPL
jgi:hypothetical protein